MHKENTEIIKAYYDAAPQMEWDRTNEGRVEYVITTKMLSRYIKKVIRYLILVAGQEDIPFG